MDSKRSNAQEPVKRTKSSQIAPSPSEETQVLRMPTLTPSNLTGYRKVAPSPLDTTDNQSLSLSAITPTPTVVGRNDGYQDNKSMMTTTPDLNPQSFFGMNDKSRMGQTYTTGIQKNELQSEKDIELNSLLGPPSRKKTNNGVAPIDASANNWRKNKERMVLYDLQQRFSINELKNNGSTALIQWQKKDLKNIKKTLYTKLVVVRNDLILNVTEQSRLEKNKNYEDRWPLLNMRKELQRIRIKINTAAYNVMKNKAFESTCMAVIGFNCYCLATVDPTAQYPSNFEVLTDNMFLGLYSIEMAVKLLALGLLFNQGAYLRDPWNMLDFVIVSSAWLTFLQETFGGGGGGSSVGALRAFRVLRPLRAVTSIKGLQVLVVSVLKSIPLLKDTFLILTFFFLIFAIAGLQLLSGLTKQVCVHIYDGSVNLEFRDDVLNQGLCGGANYCPVGDFCGQQIAGADYGTTNYDNILWGLLNVFITITMEGWSEFMVKYQKSYSWAVGPAFYIPMAYLGGYFFLNLLLAVINSSFSSCNAIQQAKLKADIEKARTKKKPVLDDDWKDVNDGEPIMEVGVDEFFISKRVARRLIEKLRARQATKLLEEAFRKANPGDNDEDEAPVTQQALIPKEAPKESEIEIHSNDEDQNLEQKQEQISEDIQDELSDESEDHRENVVKFLLQLDKEADELEKPFQIVELPRDQTFAKTETRVMMSKKIGEFNIIRGIETAKELKKIAIHKKKENPQTESKFDDLIDIGKLLDLENESKIDYNDEHALDLSFLSTLKQDNPHFSDDDDRKVVKSQKLLADGETSVILSNSSFGDQITKLQKEAKRDIQHRLPTLNPVRSITLNNIARNLRRRKTMEKQIHGDQSKQNFFEQLGDKKDDIKLVEVAPPKKKTAAEKMSLIGVGNDVKRKEYLKNISNTEETFLTMERHKNPYEFIDPKTQKIEINSGMPYQGASTEELLQLRTLMNEAIELEESNPYIKSNYLQSKNTQEKIEDSDDEYIKPVSESYQLKTVYSIKPDEDYNPYDDDEEANQLELQPYDTSLSIGFQHLLSHKPIKFRTRCSDIIVTSTLQLTIAPADSNYVVKDLALLSKEEIQTWCAKRDEFRAHNVKTASLHPKKPKDFLPPLTTQTLLKAVKRQAELRERAASGAGETTQGIEEVQEQDTEKQEPQKNEPKKTFSIPKTLLQKPLSPEVLNQLNEVDRRSYDIQKNKWEARQKQLKKSKYNPSDINFTLEDANAFEIGVFHDDANEEDQEVVIEARNKTNYFVRNENFSKQKLSDFDKQLETETPMKPRFADIYNKKDYVPDELKQELNLPDKIDDYRINYNEIIKKDCNRKRQTPMWSGQDILCVGLNEELSELVIAQINAMRVWPKGFFAYVKKFRVFLKMIIQHSLFNNMLMGAVLANTAVMALASYGITKEFMAALDSANLFFTWFFIVEMGLKFTAIGIRKYFADKMNFLDCAIVSLSIMEMILTALSGGSGGNLAAFKTIRVLRTLRVLRITRVLRTLDSMQMIISVFERSASSFAYITMLLFVFLFIYTLLGMQVFGGLLDMPTGKTRSNYDTFLIAFYTAFQVMTAENWNGNIIDYMRSPSVPIFIPPVYLVSWIFIGNYVLLNLFLAILLASFLEEDGEDGVDLEEMARLAELKRHQNVEREKVRRLKKLGDSTVRSGIGHIPGLNSKINKALQVTELIFDDVDDMENKHLTDLFIEIGIIKRKDKQREEENMFLGVQTATSLYLFSKQNPIRIYAYKLYKWPFFENFVMFLIALSSLKLAAATYEKYLAPDSIMLVVSEQFDVVLNVLFLFECCTKLIALGFILDEGSYIRDSWNQLDFFIVITSMMDMTLQNVDIPAIKVLRLLRTLRPLRVISTNVAMKLIVAALFESVAAIAEIFVVVVAVWSMFAIFGMNLFAGKFYYCIMDGEYSYSELTLHACENAGGTWQPWVENFDNIGQSLLTLFCEASTESWPDVMIKAIDASAENYGPVVEITKINGMFFIGFMLIGNFFLMNFFTGVMFLKYAQAARREKKGFTKEQLAWIDIQRMIVNAVCPFEMQYKPVKKQKFRLKAWGLVNSVNFEKTIMSIIVLNVMQMALQTQTSTQQELDLLEYANYFFTISFIIEAALKLFTYRLDYFKTAWNKFDFFVCCSSLVDIAMGFIPGSFMKTFQAGPQLARIMRVLRVTRIIKLAGKNEGLQALIQTITLAVGPIMNVFILLCLVLFIFSVLGVFFFGNIHSQWEGMAFYEYKSFVDFHHALQLMFILTTGESWNYFMYDAWKWGPYCTEGYNCGSQYAPVFFVCFVMMVQFIMINLFALVVIDQFEMYYMLEDNPISKFKKNYEVFQSTWIMMTLKLKCVRMREKQLFDFFRKLPPPIGLPQELEDVDIKKIILKMGIRSNNGYVYFNELLYRCMRRQYGNFKLGRKLQIRELTTQYAVYCQTCKAQKNESLIKDYDLFFKSMIGNGKAVNPFLTMMYFKISFLIWRKYAKNQLRLKLHQEALKRKAEKLAAMGRTFIPYPLAEEKTKQLHVMIEVDEILFLTSEEEVVNEIENEGFDGILQAEKKTKLDAEANSKQMTYAERKTLMMERSQKLKNKVQPLTQSSATVKKNKQIAQIEKSFYSTQTQQKVIVETPKAQATETTVTHKHKTK